MTKSTRSENPQTPPSPLEKVDLASAYWGVAADGFFHLVGNLRSTWYSSDDKTRKQYQFDRQHLQRYISPFQWGLGTSIFLFLNFRITGTARFQALRQRWMSHLRPPSPAGSSPSTPKPPASVSKTKTQQWQSHLEKQRNEREQAAMKSIKTLTDVLVSLSVGMSAVGLLLDAEKKTMRHDLETAPLVAGRSVFADVTCPNMIRTYTMFEEASKLPSKEELDKDDSVNLRTFITITENCRRRNNQEDLIRQRQGNKTSETVFIPYPGVR